MKRSNRPYGLCRLLQRDIRTLKRKRISTVHVRQWMERNLNGLHVYCRLMGYMPKNLARSVAMTWERIVHPVLYSR